MTIRDLLRLVLSNLKRMKARVAMTAIGVIIGTAAVVVLMSLGAGLQQLATESLYGMGGLDELMVRNDSYWGEVSPKGDGSQQQQQQTLVLDDTVLDQIRQMEGVIAVTPFLDVTMMGPLKLDRQEGWGQIYGVEMDEFAKIVALKRGTMELYRGQVVIGSMVPDNFIPWEERAEGETPPPAPELMGKILKMMQYTYNEGDMYPTESVVARLEVVGELQPQGYMYDYSIFMPLKEAQRLNQRMNAGLPPEAQSGSRKGYIQALVKVDNPNQAPVVEQQIKDMGFSVQSDRQQLESINQFFVIIQAVLGGIGAVALLVAAFGIANTMVMAIYERTREIGLMKAIGATNQDVMSVFLTEAGSIGFLGGVGGVLLALGVNAVINVAGQSFISQGSGGFMPVGPGMAGQEAAQALTATPLWLPVFAILFAVLIGVVSGIYPAIRAAALSPIHALKYE
ncbi:MAG TPA: ABC transporter permease [Anaerolineae bacterium]|mgnify:CR=1 FL=1|nr:ABC transporter permease [Anaerolineae bacterium]HQH37509.1 ABC transporter permease [Anaerolineae bacterium]